MIFTKSNFAVFNVLNSFVNYYICGTMGFDDAIKDEIRKLETEISLIDDELEKMHSKILQILALRKKKEKELRTLRPAEESHETQTSLAKVMKEIREYK
ncbi:MAG: hypothetical protein HZB65_03470 [Candidatus Aenigmarchaeota archaeon]|nr:hypothetical protein [Candidatus Aenigmarchaeota archaeon]